MISIVKEFTSLIEIDFNVSVSGQADLTVNVGLDRDDWEVAYVTMWSYNSRQSHRRSMFIIATKDIDDAWSQSVYNRSGFMPKGYLGYIIDNWDYVGITYASQGFLTKPSYGFTGRYVYVESARINGSNLEIVLHNNYSNAVNCQMKGRARMSRKVLQ